jgi:hypothetical protein
VAPSSFAPGEWTDDTALALADSLVSTRSFAYALVAVCAASVALALAGRMLERRPAPAMPAHAAERRAA